MNKEERQTTTMETDDSTLETMEIGFQEVLNELSGDEKFDKFRVEYEKVTKALRKSHENEKRLMAKCRELNAEIVSNSVKLSTAMKLVDEDQASINTLKQEIDKAWKMVEASHEKELQAKETIKKHKEEIANLNNLVEKGAGVSGGQEYSVGDLLKIKEELTEQRDKLLSEVVTLRENLTKATGAQQEIEAEKNKAMDMIAQLQQEIQVRQNEVHRETRRKEKLEKEVKQFQTDLESKQSEIKLLTQQSQRLQDDQQKLEQLLQEHKIINEKSSKEMEQLQHRNTKLQQDNEQNSINLEQLSQQNQQRASDLKMKEEEVTQLKQEITKLTRLREGAQRRLRQMEEQKAEVENQRETLKNQITGLEREMEASKNQIDADKKAIDELVRERDILNKNMIKAANETDKQQTLVKLHEQSKKTLEHEILNYRDEAQKQRKIIYQLEKERDRYINEASELTKKVLENIEDIKLKEMQIFEYKKRIAEAETKLKQQQNLYEDVRTERNLFSKNLIEAKDQNAEMRRKVKIVNHMFEQLKDEITAKEVALDKERQEFQRVERERENLKAELQKMKLQAQETKQLLAKQQAQEQELLKIIAEADAERIRQKKELDQVISERDLLGTQLVKRNDSLALLYEKVKIQQSILNKGEVHYNERLEDIRVLKIEIKKQRREKSILSKTVINVDDLRQEVFHMHRELMKERTRCRALEDELNNPLNVHRWRKLEASDPSSFELIQKIHSLQRRLISKTQEVVEKELLLQEKEKLYVELKHILARQPGPEAAEKLQVYQRTLREKTKQLKALTAELNMHESQAEGYKYEIERLVHELQEVKKKYFAQKRKDQENREKQRSLGPAGQPVIQPQRPDGPRFTGGGFSLKQHNRMTLQALEQQS
ncbi:cilia- and flagella-associated protein 58 [Danio rerio]|uniref:Cilia and flagella-associated protein 58 n=1 Tax=Danio rerio TaxID=7955 RepID=F1QGB9_DANRE|nr:cilia- and flagella-associated protein 58 [Danio rerio]|eukprot:NP_001071024.3 cilia- and flagella-associated protein 58 [Danio rerio]